MKEEHLNDYDSEKDNINDDTFPPDSDVNQEEDDELNGPEFRSINTAMDQLQLALDRLESRNAGIHEELLELLQSNREMRRSFMEESVNRSGDNQSESKQSTQESSNECSKDDEDENQAVVAVEKSKEKETTNVVDESTLKNLDLNR